MKVITTCLKFFILKAYTEQRDKHKNPVWKKKKKPLKRAMTLEEVQDGHMWAFDKKAEAGGIREKQWWQQLKEFYIKAGFSNKKMKEAGKDYFICCFGADW